MYLHDLEFRWLVKQENQGENLSLRQLSKCEWQNDWRRDGARNWILQRAQGFSSGRRSDDVGEFRFGTRSLGGLPSKSKAFSAALTSVAPFGLERGDGFAMFTIFHMAISLRV